MSLAPMRICNQPGCPIPTREGRCPQHTKAHAQAYDRDRGTSTERGYDSRWATYSKQFRQQWDMCGDRPPSAPDTKDSECEWIGLPSRAEVVDHIVPVTGRDDPNFYNQANHQALCERCHNLKRQREATQARRIG